VSVSIRGLPLSALFGLAVAGLLLVRLEPLVLLGGFAVTLLGLAVSFVALQHGRPE